MDLIQTGLYIGGSGDARNSQALHDAGITHVLSIELIKPDVSPDFVHKFVHLMDDEEYDILKQFPQCIKFIQEGIEKGGVLVHCAMGASRSAAVILSYIMHTEKLSLDDAIAKVKEKRERISAFGASRSAAVILAYLIFLERISLEAAIAKVKAIRPNIRPNDGFMHQLRVFDAMGGIIQPENPLYKQYQLDFRPEVREPVVYVTFKVSYKLDPTDGHKEALAITGEHRLLGKWRKHRLMRPKWGPDGWEITLAFSQNTTLLWKFVVVEYQKASSRQYGPKSTYGCGKVISWEGGDNRVLQTGTDQWILIEGQWGKC